MPSRVVSPGIPREKEGSGPLELELRLLVSLQLLIVCGVLV